MVCPGEMKFYGDQGQGREPAGQPVIKRCRVRLSLTTWSHLAVFLWQVSDEESDWFWRLIWDVVYSPTRLPQPHCTLHFCILMIDCFHVLFYSLCYLLTSLYFAHQLISCITHPLSSRIRDTMGQSDLYPLLIPIIVTFLMVVTSVAVAISVYTRVKAFVYSITHELMVVAAAVGAPYHYLNSI